MYAGYYGFSENPFSIKPDPRFLFMTPDQQEALDALLDGIDGQGGIMALTGEVGTGKTTLLHRLIDRLGEAVRSVLVVYTLLDFKQLLRNVLLELGLKAADHDKTALIHRLSDYLLERASEGESVVLIIDEAQNLSDEVLEEIRLLSNLETRWARPLQVVLAGQVEFEARLESQAMRALNQRISVRRHIGPLAKEECPAYIEHRLRMVGSRTSRVFTSEAVELVCRHSGRVPRLINVICDNALRVGYRLNKGRVDGAAVLEALRKMHGMFGGDAPSGTPRSRPAAPVRRTRLDMLEGLLDVVIARRRSPQPAPALTTPAIPGF